MQVWLNYAIYSHGKLVMHVHVHVNVMLSVHVCTYVDLSNPATFRDLSKPIGALNEERLAFFKVQCTCIMIS